MTTLKSLRHAYSLAKAANKYEFTLDDRVFVTQYAGFLIEFLEYRLYPENRELQFSEIGIATQCAKQ